MNASDAAAIREAADYLRGESYSAHDRWTKSEALRLAEQLEDVLRPCTPAGTLRLDWPT